MQIGCLDQTCISRYHVSCHQTDDITCYHLAAWQLTPCAIAEHAGCGGYVRAQLLDCVLRSRGLDEVEYVAEQDDDNDDAGIDPVTQYRRDDAGNEQDDD